MRFKNAARKALVLSLARMNTIRDVQPLSNMITVEAGVILQNLQEAAAKVDRFFPLSLLLFLSRLF